MIMITALVSKVARSDRVRCRELPRVSPADVWPVPVAGSMRLAVVGAGIAGLAAAAAVARDTAFETVV